MKNGPAFRSRMSGVLVVGLTLAAGLTAWSPAWGVDPAIIEGAKKEGKLVWYSSAPREAMVQFLAAFKKKYPFMDVSQLVRAVGSDLRNKIFAELEAGALQADVLHATDYPLFSELKAKGELMRYVSPEAAAYPAGARDPDGIWVLMRTIVLSIIYNTDSVKGADAPQHWKDLLKPRWRGKIATYDHITQLPQLMMYTLKGVLDRDYWVKLAAQRARPMRGGAVMMKDVISGELDVATHVLSLFYYEFGIQRGAPLKAVFPPEGVPVVAAPVGILAKAKRPHAAKLFMDYALSREGQTEFNTKILGAWSSRPDVEPPQKMPRLQSLNVVYPDSWDRFAKELPKLTEEFAKIFGMAR
ncbi:MAG: extracellular solute-binding protein [Deltaproteobacteria bacterium]|nr:extracellular solute-binding protein [Deltaproteobacteria bacterium]